MKTKLSVLFCLLSLQFCQSSPVQTEGQKLKITRIKTLIANCYLIQGEKNILIDSATAGSEDTIVDKLNEAGLKPTDLSLIIVTHGHGDHAGSAPAFQNKYKVKIAGGKGDEATFKAGKNPPLIPTGALGYMVRPFSDHHYTPFTPDILVDEEIDLKEYGIKGKIIPVGGHTPGSVVVLLDGGEAFVGDLIRGGMIFSSSPTDHFFEDDPAKVTLILKDLIKRGAKTMYPGHWGPLDAKKVQSFLD